jgi:tetratricopeptide (TPR) repeat protein
MQYKNTTKNIRKIAEELNVAAILEGTVRKEGNKVRITAQLIDANTDQHIWSEQYDRNASEVFAIQSEVAQRIANQLHAKLTPDEGKRIQKKATQNIAAYEEYLKAKQSPFQEREQLLMSALKKDSAFALAWAELAYTYSKMTVRNPADIPYYNRKSLDAALTAVNYGPDLSETHMVLGDILKTFTLNPAISIKELNKSIKLNSNNAEAYVFKAFALMELGRFNEAEMNLIKAKQLDPLSFIMKAGWVSYYRYSRKPEQFLEYINAEKILENIQGAPYSVRENMKKDIKIWYYFLKEDYDSIFVYGKQFYDPAMLGIAYAKKGKTAEARKIVDSLNSISPYDHAFSIGIIYAWMDEKQKAMEYLNLAYRLYDFNMIRIKVDKMFDPLRNEESFKELLRKMGME